MRGIAPEQEVFIVVDNYQLFRSELRREIMEVFSMHGGGLHMVFISQPLDFSSDVLGWGHILRVTAKDFLFDRESTAELCRLCSAGMDDEGVDYVQRLSGGWVAAIRLQADNYRDCGEFARYEEISQLIDAGAGRAFMMTAALPGRLPDRLVGHGVRELLLKNPFVVYSASDGFFHMHELMRRFLRARLDASPPDFRRTADAPLSARAARRFAAGFQEDGAHARRGPLRRGGGAFRGCEALRGRRGLQGRIFPSVYEQLFLRRGQGYDRLFRHRLRRLPGRCADGASRGASSATAARPMC